MNCHLRITFQKQKGSSAVRKIRKPETANRERRGGSQVREDNESSDGGDEERGGVERGDEGGCEAIKDEANIHIS